MIGVTVSSGDAVLVVAVFIACAVEMVEALTIVFAVGHTRGWRSALQGSASALVVLAALVGAFGPALVHVPIGALRLIVGGVLLVFGLQWLRKAILRSSGFLGKHDEDAIYKKKVAELVADGRAPGHDHVAFVVAFKGVFLEGLEVVVAVLTLGTAANRLGLAIISAGAALVVVGVVGAVVAKQLSRVPENAMKTLVGVMLVSYGTFWTGEGLKVKWPGGDTMLVGLVGIYLVVTWAYVAWLRSARAHELEVSA
jgi:Ca2+/H+ antiporter, TMEM165/GDT1 family